MKPLLAAIAPSPDATDPLSGLRENLPPVEVPWPEWAWWAMGAGAIVLCGSLIALGVWWGKRKLIAQPLSPRHIAKQELQRLRAEGLGMDGYAFGIAVSDILRTYISQHYGLQATQQTSPEFLASIAKTTRFTDEERRLLAVFLEQCDMRKFARVEAAENETLLQSAEAFVEGVQP